MHHRCHWHRAVNIANFAGVNDTGEACLRRCQWHRQFMHCRCCWHRWCTSRTFGSSPMRLKEQSVKKQAISRYYFSIASIQSMKESSNYNKIVCLASVSDTSDAPEKLNISANIRKKSKSLPCLSTGARRSCLKKKNQRYCPFNILSTSLWLNFGFHQLCVSLQVCYSLAMKEYYFCSNVLWAIISKENLSIQK